MRKTLYGISVHPRHDTNCEIGCHTQHSEGIPEDYPVIHFADVSIFPSVEQVERLRDVLTAWLDAQQAPSDEMLSTLATPQ